MPVRSPAKAATKPQGKSRVSNGSALLSGADGRSTWARRFRDLISLHVADLGGAEVASVAEKSIVRRAAAITVELERLEAKFAKDGQACVEDLDLYQRAAGNLRRLLEAVGLERKQRDVTPSLTSYLASRAAAQPAGCFSGDAAAQQPAQRETPTSDAQKRLSSRDDRGGERDGHPPGGQSTSDHERARVRT
ncbi:MAG TPA: hypothetical protein VGU01_13735 [Sphingomicrobium sp.]|nr:hypothetical protein [Sphingomicrobium sp.]